MLARRLGVLNAVLVGVEALTFYMYSIPPRLAATIPTTAIVLVVFNVLVWTYYRQRTPRLIVIDDAGLRVERHNGNTEQIAWTEVAGHRHLDAIVCYHWVLTAQDGRQINIAELGMTRPEWRHLFDRVDKHVARYVL